MQICKNGWTNWKTFLTNLFTIIIWHLFVGESHQVVTYCTHVENAGNLWQCQHVMKMLAPYWNVGVLWKSWCLIEILASYEKVSALLKCTRYWIVGSLWKSHRLMKMLALYENVGALWKCWHSIQQELKNIQL
jgi:hypothetical protein